MSKPDDLTEREQQLIRCIEGHGFEVMYGEFLIRNGARSEFYLKPVNAEKLMQRALQALRYAKPKEPMGDYGT